MNWRSAWMICAVAAASAAAPMTAFADEYQLDSLRIDHALARATPPGAKTGIVFLTVDNAGNTTDRLLHASTPIAGGVALHQMAVDEGMMKMRAVPSIEIRPGARVELQPGGYHLMLLDLKQPLKVGEKFPLTLTFAQGGAVTVSVQVEGMGAMPAERK
jgi:periplasmic copper chaperone A